MNQGALDQLSYGPAGLPTPAESLAQGAMALPDGNIASDLSPILQSFKDQQAKRRRKADVDKYFGGEFSGMTTEEIQEAQAMSAEARAAQEIVDPGKAIAPPKVGQVQFHESEETRASRRNLEREQADQPVQKDVGRKPVSEKDFIVSAVLSSLFPEQSKAINSVPIGLNERDYQEELAKSQRQYAMDDRAHQQRMEVLRELLKSAEGSDQDKFNADKFNTEQVNVGERTRYSQEMQSGRTETSQEGQDRRAKLKAGSSEVNTLIRQTASDNPQSRADAATRLKTVYGFDIYDPSQYSQLEPAEQAAMERANSLREKRPFEIAQIVATTKVKEETARKIHQEVEYFPEVLRIKLAMLKGYLANIGSMVHDREADRDLRSRELWDKKVKDETGKAEKELEGLKKDLKEKKDERQRFSDALKSGYYTDEPSRKFAEERVRTLDREIGDLDEQVTDAQTKLDVAKDPAGGQLADPLQLDPSLKGPVNGTVHKDPLTGRAGKRARASHNPYMEIA